MQGRMVKKIGEFKGLKLEWPPENKFYIHTMKIWERVIKRLLLEN